MKCNLPIFHGITLNPDETSWVYINFVELLPIRASIIDEARYVDSNSDVRG